MANGEEVHRLAVAIEPQGMDETQDKLKETSETFEDTAADVEKSSTDFSDFTRKFRGAGLVFGAAFGTMVAAVASKLPVIKEVGAGVNSVLTSLALAIDENIRPSMNDLTQDFFDLSEKIADAEGSAEAVGIALGGLAGIISRRVSGALDGLTIETTLDFIIKVGRVAIDIPSLKQAISRQIQQKGVGGILADGLLKAFPQARFIDDIAQVGFDAGVKFTSSLLGVAEKRVKSGIASVVNPIIVQLNRIIRKVNRIQGINISELDPLATGPVSGAGGRNQFRRTDPATGGSGKALTPGGEVVVTGTLEQETNLDSQTVAESTKPFTVKGVLGGGRGARLR